MKLKYIAFLFLTFYPISMTAQVDTLHANFMFNQIDKSVLVADCDTFNVVFDFSPDQFINRMPISISLDNNPSLSEYWLNESSLTITEDNPYWSLKIYVDSTWATTSPDFLRFKLLYNNNNDGDFDIHILPELPYFDVIPLFDEDNFVLCEYGNANFILEPDTLFNNVPYKLDFYDASSETKLDLFGNELYFEDEDWWNILTYPELNIEVRALNCSQSLATYPVLQNSFSFYDTITCKNEPIEFLWQSEIHYPDSSVHFRLSGVNENGCDSIVILRTDYLPADFEVQQIAKLPEESVLFHDSLIYDFGNYIANSQNVYGCDSSDILTIVPLDVMNYLEELANQPIIYKSICEEQSCFSFYLSDYTDYRYIINNIPYEFSDLDYCTGSFRTVKSFVVNANFIAEDKPYRAENILIHDVNYPDFYFRNIQELVNGLNAIFPLGNFIKGYDNSEIFSSYDALEISFTYRNLETYDRKFFHPSGIIDREIALGLSLPLDVGYNNLRIEHKSLPFAKNISPYVYEPDADLSTPEVIEYLPEINNKVQFPLITSLLCGRIVSAQQICPEDWEGIVEYSITDEGLLTFEAIKPYNSVGCFELCDEFGNCATVLLQLNFLGDRADLSTLDYSIFPNPVSNLVYITHEPATNIIGINIFDINGRQKTPNIFIHKNIAEIDVSNYEEGLLFMEIHTDMGEVILEKIIIQR